MNTTNRTVRPALALMLVMIAACGGSGEGVPSSQSDAPGPGMTGMEGMPPLDMGAMQTDPAVMRRQAQEMDSMVAEMREHVRSMREAGPEEWHARMGEHASRVGGTMGMMERQMRGMGPGMGMGSESMGARMGMTAEEYERMIEEMRALHAEAEQLRDAPPSELRQRMPGHLDRMDRMMETMEQPAAHMRTP